MWRFTTRITIATLQYIGLVLHKLLKISQKVVQLSLDVFCTLPVSFLLTNIFSYELYFIFMCN